MSEVLVRDYLQTQGLKLAAGDVAVARLAAETVMNMGQAEIDRSVLWGNGNEACAADYFTCDETTEQILKQVFMALDSTWEQSAAQSAAVYVLLPDQAGLLRLSQQGRPVEALLKLDEEAEAAYLPSRTANRGWLNLVEDTARWLEAGEISGEHHARNGSQMSLPVCLENGRVLGVIQVEAAQKNGVDETAQALWVALALALAAPLAALLGAGEEDE